MPQHFYALRKVRRDPQVPNCPDSDLVAARDAGLIVFASWPRGHWVLTEEGADVLNAAD